MTDILVSQLLPASFKGVEFRVRSEIEDQSGRRIVLHEYPNSSERFIEDLGQIPPSFKVEAFVHGPNYLARARALRAALNEKGPGELVLPTFGTVTAYALPFSSTSDHKEIGEVRFSLEFALGRPTAGPTTRENEIEDLYDEADRARAEVQIALALLWGEPETALNIATAQYDLLQTVQSTINQYSRLFRTGDLTAFQDTANDIARNRAFLVDDAAALAAALIQNVPDSPGLWQQISQGVPNGAGVDAAIAGVNFGALLSTQAQEIRGASPTNVKGEALSGDSFTSSINLWNETTSPRLQRNRNRRALVGAYRVCSLLTAYEQAAAATYETEDQINAVREQLYRAYDVVMRDGLDEADGEETIQGRPEVREAVNAVRFIAGEILQNKSQNSPGLTFVELNAPRSALELAYLLYCEDLTTTKRLEELAEDVRALTPTQPAVSLSGRLTVFDRR